MKRKRIKIPIYFGLLEIVVCTNLKEALIKNKEPLNGFNPENYEAFVWDDLSSGIAVYKIYIKPTASHKTVAHESIHIVNLLFNNIGAKPYLNNDEPQAYLLGWVVEQIHKVLDNHSK